MNDVVRSSQTGAKPEELDSLLAPSSPELFWRARYLCSSVHLEHIPFLFWLTNSVRPRRSVVFGVGDGALYFALCQALKKLNDSATCLGLDEWNSAEGEVPNNLRAYNAQTYPDFSTLKWIRKSEAPEYVEEAAIDLLLFDCEGSPQLLETIKSDWLSKLTNRGLLVLTNFGNAAENLELNRQIEDLKNRWTYMEFPQAGGMLVLLAGSEQPARLTRLISAVKASPASFDALRSMLGRLGGGIRHEWEAHNFSERAWQTNAELQKAHMKVEALETAHKEVHEELETLKSAYEKRHSAAARLQVECTDHRNNAKEIRKTLEAERDRFVTELSQLKASFLGQVTDRDQQLVEMRKSLDCRTEERDRNLAEIAQKTNELALVTKRLDGAAAEMEKIRDSAKTVSSDRHRMLVQDVIERDTRLSALQKSFEALSVERDRLAAATEEKTQELTKLTQHAETRTWSMEQEILRLREERDYFAAEREALLTSTSWKVTGPLRSVVRAVRPGQK